MDEKMIDDLKLSGTGLPASAGSSRDVDEALDALKAALGRRDALASEADLRIEVGPALHRVAEALGIRPTPYRLGVLAAQVEREVRRLSDQRRRGVFSVDDSGVEMAVASWSGGAHAAARRDGFPAEVYLRRGGLELTYVPGRAVESRDAVRESLS